MTIPAANTPLLKISDILKKSFLLYKNNFVTLTAIAAVFFLLEIMALNISSMPLPTWLLLGGLLIVKPLLSAYATIALIIAIARLAKGEPVEFMTAFKEVRGHFWIYVIAFFLLTSVQSLGFFLLIIPGIYLSVIFCLVPISAVMDDKPLFDHFRISKTLIKGSFWKVLLTLAIFLLPLIGSVIALNLWLGVETYQLLSPFLYMLLMPFGQAISVVIYLTLSDFKRDELARFAYAKEAKGSQWLAGIFACLGVGFLALIASGIFFLIVGTAFQHLPFAKFCPLPLTSQQPVSYLEEAARLTRTPDRSHIIATEAYDLYIPAGLTVDERHPLVILLAPNANPRPLISAWMPAANKHKWVLFGSKEYSNSGDMQRQAERIVDLLKEVTAYFPVDETMLIASGLSGGGMGSHYFAEMRPDLIQAVVPNVGMMPHHVYGASEDYPQDKHAVFVASPTDFRYEEMQQDQLYLQQHGWKTHWIEFEGGHRVAPDSAYVQAANWLQTHLVEGKPVTESPPGAGENQDEPVPDGEHTAKYPGGGPSILAIYQNGQRHGPYKSYYPSGQVWSEGTYLEDKKHGMFTVYNEDGSLQSVNHYEMGLRHGWMEQYTDGSLEYKDRYEHGEKVRHEHFQKGQLDHVEEWQNGTEARGIYYDDEGREVMTVNYKDGEPQFDWWQLLKLAITPSADE